MSYSLQYVKYVVPQRESRQLSGSGSGNQGQSGSMDASPNNVTQAQRSTHRPGISRSSNAQRTNLRCDRRSSRMDRLSTGTPSCQAIDRHTPQPPDQMTWLYESRECKGSRAERQTSRRGSGLALFGGRDGGWPARMLAVERVIGQLCAIRQPQLHSDKIKLFLTPCNHTAKAPSPGFGGAAWQRAQSCGQDAWLGVSHRHVHTSVIAPITVRLHPWDRGRAFAAQPVTSSILTVFRGRSVRPVTENRDPGRPMAGNRREI